MAHRAGRDLIWDGCANVRDLGGHRIEDGRATRFGSVVRADSVRQLSDAGWGALVSYGVRTVIDLRFHSELEADPPDELPVEVIHIPLLGDLDPARSAELEAIGQAAAGDAAATQAVYGKFLEWFPENFALAVASVARAPVGGVLVHCQAGKDRTGLVTALLLRLAGVGIRAIGEDYAVSGRRLAALREDWIAEAEHEAERARRRRISATPAASMIGVLEELERSFGSVAGYLRSGAAAEEDIVRARGRLLD